MAISASARAALFAGMASMLCAFAVRDHYDDLGSPAHLDRETADNTRQVALLQDATSSGKVKIMVLDFDATLAIVQVCTSLAGEESDEPDRSVPLWGDDEIGGSRANTELGQVRLIRKLDDTRFGGRGGFARAAFGGMVRVERMATFLQKLNALGVKCYIVSGGFIGVIITMLEDLNLLKYFEGVYGRVGQGKKKSLKYDKEQTRWPPLTDDEKRVIGAVHSKAHKIETSRKNVVIRTIKSTVKQQVDVEKSEVMFVDDDYRINLMVDPDCSDPAVGEAMVLHVNQVGLPFMEKDNVETFRRGIRDPEMKYLLGVCDGTIPYEVKLKRPDGPAAGDQIQSHQDDISKTQEVWTAGSSPTRSSDDLALLKPPPSPDAGWHSDSEVPKKERTFAGGLFGGGGGKKSTKPRQRSGFQ